MISFIKVYDDFQKLGLSWARPSELAVYALIYSFNTIGKPAHFSYKYLSSRLGINRTSAINAINSLIEKGLISKVMLPNFNGENEKNTFIINREKLRELHADDLFNISIDINLTPDNPQRKHLAEVINEEARAKGMDTTYIPSKSPATRDSDRIYRKIGPRNMPWEKYLYRLSNDPQMAYHLDTEALFKDPVASKSYASFNYLRQRKKTAIDLIKNSEFEKSELSKSIADLNGQLKVAQKQGNTVECIHFLEQIEQKKKRILELEKIIKMQNESLDEINAKRERIDPNDPD